MNWNLWPEPAKMVVFGIGVTVVVIAIAIGVAHIDKRMAGPVAPVDKELMHELYKACTATGKDYSEQCMDHAIKMASLPGKKP